MVTRMREKGQITIPAGIRESLHLEKDSVLRVSKVGEAILLTSKPSVFDSVANRFGDASEKQGITLEGLLKDLRKIRR